MTARERYAWVVCPCRLPSGPAVVGECNLCDSAGRLCLPLIRLAAGSAARSGMGKIRYTAADRAWAAEVKQRDGRRCRRCGRGAPDGVRLQAAHITSRRNGAQRHDLGNGVTLCVACHRWADADPARIRLIALAGVGH